MPLNYFSYTQLNFNRSSEYPDNPEMRHVHPNDFQVYDVNGDGNLDILVAYSFAPLADLPGIPIRILLGDGQGGFTDGTPSLLPNPPLADAVSAPTVDDFNGDGVEDVFIPVTGYDAPPYPGGQALLLLSNGSGGVIDATPTNIPQIKDGTHWSTSSDIDGDGDIDIFADSMGYSDNEGGDVSAHFLINDGSGNFARSDTRLPELIETGYRTYTSSLLFDADNDGDSDLFLGMWGPPVDLGTDNGRSRFSLILFNNGQGEFEQTAGSVLPTPRFGENDSGLLDTQPIDLNGDGYQDLLALASSNDTVDGYIQVLINRGDGSFYDDTFERLGSQTYIGSRYLDLIDINEDGFRDIVLQSGDDNRIYLNDGAGSFVALPAEFLDTQIGSSQSIVGDFNNDGHVDFLLSDGVDFEEEPGDVTEHYRMATWTQPALLDGNAAANALLGMASAETLNGYGGNDTIFGGGGRDTLNGGSGNDYLNGGLGTDTASYVGSSAGVNVSLATGTGTGGDAQGDTLIHIENLTGSDHNDTLTGDAGVNVLQGGTGNDTIYGDQGNDTLNGGTGADWLYGGADRDTLVGGAGGDFLFGNRGIDFIDPGAGSDQIDGGGDFDRVWYGDSPTYVKIDLSTGTGKYGNAAGDTYTGIERITGSAFADVLIGNEVANAIKGGGGRDTINGLSGRDVIEGQAANDTLYGGSGNDVVVGGDGNDRVYGNRGFDRVDGGLGDDQLWGGNDVDYFVFVTEGSNGFGQDIIRDFDDGADRIDVRGVHLRADASQTADEFSDFMIATSNVGLKVKFEGGQVIYLDTSDNHMTVADIDAADFVFA